MLPPKFRTYFDQQCGAALADCAMALDAASRRLKDDAMRAGGGLGGRYFAGLQGLYSREAGERGRAILRALKTAAGAFVADLTPAHDEEILELVDGIFAAQVEGLRSSYHRTAGRYTDRLPQHLEDLSDLKVAAESVGFINSVRRYLWEVHNLPRPAATMTNSNTVNVSGNVYGPVQAGSGATATVQQSITTGATTEALIAALQVFAKELQSAHVDPDARDVVISQAAAAEQELRSAAPSRARLLGYLGGIGAVVQTLGSGRDAWDTIRQLAQACGIQLP